LRALLGVIGYRELEMRANPTKREERAGDVRCKVTMGRGSGCEEEDWRGRNG